MNYKKVVRNFTVCLVIVAIPVSANFIKNDRSRFYGVENTFLHNDHKNMKSEAFTNTYFRLDNSVFNNGCTWNPLMMRPVLRQPVLKNKVSFNNHNQYLPVTKECFLNNPPEVRISERNCHMLYNNGSYQELENENETEAAIPEPGIVLLMAAGLLSAGGLCLRRKI